MPILDVTKTTAAAKQNSVAEEVLPWLESWAAWESSVVMLKADGPAVRIL